MNSTREPAAGKPSASGVRRGGDDYQDLVVWTAALQLVLPRPLFDLLEVEAVNAGSLDDAVLRTADPDEHGDRFTQVKWATKESLLVNDEYLLKVEKGSARSLLKKLYDSYVLLASRPGQGAFTMELFTNRSTDPGDKLLTLVDGRTGYLMPAADAVSADSSAGKQLKAWAAHLKIEHQDLLNMLKVLRWRTGRDKAGEREHAKTLMRLAGLRYDDAALDLGLAAAASWVRDGSRAINPEDVLTAIDQQDLSAGEPTATLLIDAIDHAADPDAATIHLDWVDTYAESSPALRRVPSDPASWAVAQSDVRAAASDIERLGISHLVIRGHFRQATAFMIGAEFPKTRGHTLSYERLGTTWSTDAARTNPRLDVDPIAINNGTDLAVLVATAADAQIDVSRYITDDGLPIRTLLVFRPKKAGTHDEFVQGPAHAVGIAGEIRAGLRSHLESAPDAERLHLFLAGPNGLALILGHRWNGLRPTTVYEHQGPGRGYTPAFDVAG